jgi:hypothetical protein
MGVESTSATGATLHSVVSSCWRLFHISAAVRLDPYENDNGAEARDSFLGVNFSHWM